MQQYVDGFNTVWPLLALLAIISVIAPKMGLWVWRVIRVVAGISLAIFGGFVAFMAIATGGNAHVGSAALFSFAGGTAWTFVWLLYYWEHRSSKES